MLDDCAPLTLARDQQAAEPGPKMLFFTFIFPGVLFHQAKPTLVLVGAFVGHSAWVGSAGSGSFDQPWA